MSAQGKKLAALAAAWGWLGMYEAEPTEARDVETFGYSVNLDDAFSVAGTAARVKRRFPGFPEDMVDAYALLRRMVNARKAGRA